MSRRCVVLIGMMGSGKSEVGEMLAEQLGYEFLDTDSLISKKAGKPIHKIFKEEGEVVFRDLENEIISGLADLQATVVATGGGAPVNKENRGVLARLGHTVYLKASPRELYLRVKNDRSRPLLQVADPQKEIEQILENRKMAYETADIIIDTEDLNVDEVVDQLIDELARRTVETQL